MVFKKAMKPLAVLASLATLIMSGSAFAEYAVNFQDPVTPIARDIYDLHMLIFWICTFIFIAVFSVMFYSIFKHRKSKGAVASKFNHSTTVEIIWTIIPFFILVGMAIPATKVLIDMEDTTKSDHTIKITGYQWKWGYEYLGTDISFYSTLTTPRNQIEQFDEENAEEQGENYLLEVDNHVIVPSGRKIRALITANDVIHAWWIPAFGSKKDAIPGYINEIWFRVDEGKEGIYRGQCAELCGKDHAFMPIVVEVVTGEQYDNWIASGGTSFDASPVAEESEEAASPVVEEAEAAPVAGKTWTKEELLGQGESVYQASCVSCHGANGEGIQGVFPAITGSKVATGDVAAHIDIIMNGKPGTAMMPFVSQLSDEDIASVVTYQRNALGNNVGDVVLPADIKALRN